MDASRYQPTIGVEEEFLLLDPSTGRPRPVAEPVLRRLAGRTWPRRELMRYQVEAATGVCAGIAQVGDQLWRMRRDLAVAAADVAELIAAGDALDERAVYFLARLSPRYPTVEVRVPDVAPDLDTTLLITALVRALVVTALRGPAPTRSGGTEEELVAAAHSGLDAAGLDPRSGRWTTQRRLLRGLRSYVDEALAETGDREAVDRCLMLLAERGTGAERQLRHWRRDPTPEAFVSALARTTLTAPMPAPAAV